MSPELHIRIHADSIASIDAILTDFPYEPGQAVISYMGDAIIVDLAGCQDTNYIQEWFLNSNDDVMSFYVVDD